MCKDIIGKLLKHKKAWPFEQPVDPKALKLVSPASERRLEGSWVRVCVIARFSCLPPLAVALPALPRPGAPLAHTCIPFRRMALSSCLAMCHVLDDARIAALHPGGWILLVCLRWASDIVMSGWQMGGKSKSRVVRARAGW